MMEMKETGPRQVTLWEDGAVSGGAAWDWEELAWGRERVKVARLTRFDAPEKDRLALWAYLEFLWEGQAVAAAREPDGGLRWYSKLLERSWQAAQN